MELLTLHLRGGQSPQYRAGKFTVQLAGAHVTTIKWEDGCTPELLYFDADAIDAIDVVAIEEPS